MKQLQSKDLNFLRVLQPVQQEKPKNSRKAFLIIPPTLLLVLGLGTWGGLQWQHMIYEKRSAAYSREIQDLQKDKQYTDALGAEERLTALQIQVKNAQLIRDALDSYPELTDAMFAKIQQCAGDSVTITGYSYNAADGLFIISGKAEGITDAAIFVRKLRGSGIFATLGYTGHFLDLTDQEAAGYLFDASGALEGREAVTND